MSMESIEGTSHQEPSSEGNAKYHSHFGGLWIDRDDYPRLLQNRISSQKLTQPQAELIEQFVKNGYVIIPNAVDPQLIDQINTYTDRLWTKGSSEILVGYLNEYQPVEPSSRNVPGTRIIDHYHFDRSARDALLNPALVDFLRTIFDEEPLLFQSLYFERGSEQAVHQDTAYVVVDQPLKLAAVWIALEDIKAGSGELCYYTGSHRLPDFIFPENRKNFILPRDGHEVHVRFLESLHEQAKKQGLKRDTFLAKKGDILIWHADLAHGGSPITDPLATRRSLVGHYCPVSANPEWAKKKIPSKKRHSSGGYSTSWYYGNGSIRNFHLHWSSLKWKVKSNLVKMGINRKNLAKIGINIGKS